MAAHQVDPSSGHWLLLDFETELKAEIQKRTDKHNQEVQQKIDAFRKQRDDEASKLDMETEKRLQAFHASNDGFAKEIAALVNAQLAANSEFKRLMGGQESMDVSQFQVSNKRRMGNQGQPICMSTAVDGHSRVL